jgi:nicotinamide-nucleotide amidase
MDVAILSIGTELLMGELVDTNASYLAAQMPPLGLTVRGVSQVGDDLDDLKSAIRRAWEESQFVVTTGGLGPTSDDLTRAAIAEFLGEDLQLNSGLSEDLRAFFEDRGIPMLSTNLKQAELIPSAQPLPNRRGTAPGWWVETGDKVIIALPGPPHEMTTMWEQQVVPRLKGLASGDVILTRTLKTFGAGESIIEEAIHHLFGHENPYLGIYAKADGVHLRIIARGASHSSAWALIEPVETEIRDALKDYLWGVAEETPQERLGDILRSNGLTLATMESLTGGSVASRITDVPGSSDYFRGGFVTYTNTMKVAMGVDPKIIEEYGVVSPQVAEAMSEAARCRADSDVGLGITGVAGPAELDRQQPGEVYIGLSFQGETRSIRGFFMSQRVLVKERATVQALLELYKFIKERV